MRRVHQIILIGSTIVGSWIGMQAVHELGHVIAAWLTGAEVKRVVLTPTTLSRTDVVNHLHPLVVVWAGRWLALHFPSYFGFLRSLHAYQAHLSSDFLPAAV